VAYVTFKIFKRVTLAAVLAVAVFLFTRPSDYRNLWRDVSGSLEDQWCAWSELVGNECDRWRHARRIIDEVKQFGEEVESRFPATAPNENAGRRQD